MPFVKVDTAILDSSVWSPRDLRSLFLTALFMAKPYNLKKPTPQLCVRSLEPTGWIVPPGEYGIVEAAGSRIIERDGQTLEGGLPMLEQLGERDDDSKNPEYDGRRIVRVAGGYLVLNFRLYRDKDYTAATRMRRLRERQRSAPEQPGGLPAPPSETPSRYDVTRNVTQAEAEGEGEVEAKDLTPAVAVNGDVTRNVPDAVKLTRMLNRGMADNPAIGQAYNPVIATSGHSHDATEQLKAAGVPIEFAETWVYTYASAYKPKKPGDQISSLSYLVPAVVDAWQRANAKTDAAAAPLPPESRSNGDAQSGNPPPKLSGNGTYTLRAGEIINLIRSWRPPTQPETLPDNPADFVPGPGGRMERIRPRAEWVAPPPAWRAGLNPDELRAVDAIGVDRIRSDEKPGIILAHLSKALHEAVRG